MTSADRRARTLEEIRPFAERARAFSGWTFKGLSVPHLDQGPPWDYEELARDAVAGAERVLDLGTGGGEVLSSVVAGSASRCVATEEWVVNAPVAQRRLSPIGVDVVRCNSLRLPLRDGSFDLVLDRHEALQPAEVARVLRGGGRVITQQVGSDSWPELRRFFPRKTDFGPFPRLSARLRRGRAGDRGCALARRACGLRGVGRRRLHVARGALGSAEFRSCDGDRCAAGAR
jgi:SAM-dependent methyltransferase